LLQIYFFVYILSALSTSKNLCTGSIGVFFERAPKGIRYGKTRLGPGFCESKNSYEERDGTNISNLVGDYIS